MSLTIKFKIIPDYSISNISTSQSIVSDIHFEDIDSFFNCRHKLYGGYCVSLDGIPWNGYLSDDTGQPEFAIDHIEGALSMLIAVCELGEKSTHRNDIWQVDGSNMRMTSFGRILSIEDSVYGFENVKINCDEFMEEFINATKDFIIFLRKLERNFENREDYDMSLISYVKDNIDKWYKTFIAIQHNNYSARKMLTVGEKIQTNV